MIFGSGEGCEMIGYLILVVERGADTGTVRYTIKVPLIIMRSGKADRVVLCTSSAFLSRSSIVYPGLPH